MGGCLIVKVAPFLGDLGETIADQLKQASCHGLYLDSGIEIIKVKDFYEHRDTYLYEMKHEEFTDYCKEKKIPKKEFLEWWICVFHVHS